MSVTEDFDFDWRFALGDCEAGARPAYASADFDDLLWRALDLPHDWSVEGPFSPESPAGGACAWAPCGIGWYRKSFDYEPSPAAGLARLEFDGAYRRARVYLNGELLASHDHGFSSFSVDLGDRLISGRNVVAVRVDNSDVPNCRWYTGSGIYRRVRLVRYGSLRFEPWGLSLSTPRINALGAIVHAELEVHAASADEAGSPRRFDIEVSIVAPSGAEAGRVRRSFDAGNGELTRCAIDLPLHRPEPWSPDSPALYSLEARLIAEGAVVDESRSRLGIRTPEFRGGSGFFLNGRSLKLKGVCLHQDGGAVGAAVPEAVWRRRLGALKAMGCNAIRCAHNAPDPLFLDLCDELGFLVIDEAFDKWEGAFTKPEGWYMRQADFAGVWEEALRSCIRRDRNHPSVILWSVGNEMGQPGTTELEPWLDTLCDAARTLDPTRKVSAAFVSSNAATVEEKVMRIMASAAKVDVLCVNYQEPLYGRYHAVDPSKTIIGSETFVHWRGIEGSVHAFGLRNPWYDVVENDYVAGQFLWPGIDYLGEASAWPSKGWDVGVVDTSGRIKAGGQFHRSAWSSEPMVALAVRDHGMGKGEAAFSWGGYSLSRHWNWPELEKPKAWPEVGGRLVEVELQSNCDNVELVLNGLSYGERRVSDFVNGAVLYLVPYLPGTLCAIGRRKGVEVARDELVTAGRAVGLRLASDRRELRSDGYDAAQVEIELVDEEGRRVPREDLPISVSVEGPARLLGLDNGDLASPEGYADGVRTSSGGYCLAILGRARSPGRVTLRASARASDGRELAASIEIMAR
jgi:Beta-galactosidase/beta-glucuronidase